MILKLLSMASFTEVGAICGVCKNVCKPLRCKGCESAIYCSKQCQKNDWKSHKPLCVKDPNFYVGEKFNTWISTFF